jgi:hypothetical protein
MTGGIFILFRTHILMNLLITPIRAIELYYIDGKIIIGDVAKGSPAEEAGIKETML